MTCAFVLRGGEPCGLRDAYSRPDYMFCVSSCLSKPAPDATLETQRREKGRVRAPDFFSPNGKHTEHFSRKNVSFICFLPASFYFVFFFFLIAEDSSPERLEVSPSCGKSGGSCRITLWLSHAKSAASLSTQTYIPPLPLPQPWQRQSASGQKPQRPATEV